MKFIPGPISFEIYQNGGKFLATLALPALSFQLRVREALFSVRHDLDQGVQKLLFSKMPIFFHGLPEQSQTSRGLEERSGRTFIDGGSDLAQTVSI